MEKGFDIAQAGQEACKCLLCYDAPCSKSCPAGTDPAKFIRKLRFRNLTGAIRTIKSNNVLGGACGVLCPSERLCEKECVAKGLDKPVQIKKIQRALIEHSWKIGFTPLKKGESRGKKAAVIGAGPAGLSCAAELAKSGFGVTVFDQKESAGGVLGFGVPNHRLDKEFLASELKDIEKLGVEFKFKTKIKTKEEFEKLTHEFDAVFVATGLWRAENLAGLGPANGLFSSIRFLEILKAGNTDEVEALIKNKRIAVVGGGNVAIDCAESAIKFGAKDVWLVYRRSYKEMPAEEAEKISAQNNGVVFLLLNQPTGLAVEGNKLTGLHLARTALGPPDASGRRTPVEIKESRWTLETDIVVEAIGNTVEESTKSWHPVFAGGDAVRGPSLIVDAIADGKMAAKAIAERL